MIFDRVKKDFVCILFKGLDSKTRKIKRYFEIIFAFLKDVWYTCFVIHLKLFWRYDYGEANWFL